MKSKKSLGLPKLEEIGEISREELLKHFEVTYDELERAHKRMTDDLGRLEAGTAVGQMLYWDGYTWVPISTANAIWDADNNRLGLNTAEPTSTLDVRETVTATRILAGGVKEF